jgi:hypothetical protein
MQGVYDFFCGSVGLISCESFSTNYYNTLLFSIKFDIENSHSVFYLFPTFSEFLYEFFEFFF